MCFCTANYRVSFVIIHKAVLFISWKLHTMKKTLHGMRIRAKEKIV